MSRLVIFLVWMFFFFDCCGEEQQSTPRTVIAIYDGLEKQDIFYTNIHNYAEMSLNHLGIIVEYHDISQGLPNIEKRDDVLGVITWFKPGFTISDPEAYLRWAMQVFDAGKRYVVLGNSGLYLEEGDAAYYLVDEFWYRLGLRDEGRWEEEVYRYSITKMNSGVVGFERTFRDEKPGFAKFSVISDQVRSHLTFCQVDGDQSCNGLIVTGPNGGYVNENYAIYSVYNTEQEHDFRKWYINPFEFFRITFDTDVMPKPDTTTMAGRRIYYSHIDGDGWNNVATVKKNRVLASEVLYQEVFTKYDDLPVTIGPIIAELAKDWHGTKQSRKIARKIFRLPHVEVACHTYTHPFAWGFFEHYDQDSEQVYIKKYSEKGNPISKAFRYFNSVTDDHLSEQLEYDIPRAYYDQPFDLTNEVQGVVKGIKKVIPKEKKLELYLWSGDCQPFEAAIKMTRETGIRNLNGGDARFDKDFDSYAWVTPLSRQVGNQRQIYSSLSNENTYINQWEDHYYGFRQLPETLKNTETPIRVKPINLYYHMFSGEKLAALNALKQNIDYIRSQEIIPITASRYAAIVDGFFSLRIVPLRSKSWRIENRDALQTMRFDRASLMSVDFENSKGVIGQRHLQGSLYVYLDESVDQPIVTLKENEKTAARPYLQDSRWRVWNVNTGDGDDISMYVQGFGKGEMRWVMPHDGEYEIVVKGASFITKTNNHVLSFQIEASAISGLQLEIKRVM